VDENRKPGHRVDYNKELELVRLKHDAGKMTDADYDKEISRLGAAIYKRQKAEGGNAEDPEFKKVMQAMKWMMRNVEKSDPARVNKIREEYYKSIYD